MGIETHKLSHERNKTPEYIPSDSVFEYFLHMTHEQFTVFCERVSAANGHVRIVVHPLFLEQSPGSARSMLDGKPLEEAQNTMRKGFLRIVENVTKDQRSSPLIIYEAHNQVEQTRHIISDYVGCKPEDLESRGIAFIHTQSASSGIDSNQLLNSFKNGDIQDQEYARQIEVLKTALKAYDSKIDDRDREICEKFPDMCDEHGRLFYSPNNVTEEVNEFFHRHYNEIRILEKEYARLIKLFDPYKLEKHFIYTLYTRLGVLSALVSGAYVIVDHNKELIGCGGSIIESLRENGMCVDISNLVWPPKHYIKDAGIPVKQTGKK